MKTTASSHLVAKLFAHTPIAVKLWEMSDPYDDSPRLEESILDLMQNANTVYGTTNQPCM